MPDGVQHLAEILKRGIVDGSIDTFHRLIRSQDGVLRNDGNQWFTPEEILHMDWLCDCVDGSIPDFDQLLPMSSLWFACRGVYRDRIPPEKEGTPPVKILLVSDEECLYLWDYYRPGRLDGIDLIISLRRLKCGVFVLSGHHG